MNSLNSEQIWMNKWPNIWINYQIDERMTKWMKDDQIDE